MMKLNVGEKEYLVKFGYNSFCDTDLMDRTEELLKIFQSAEVEEDKDATIMGKIKELFSCVRDLLFVGFEKFNPVESVQEIGDILDEYHDEKTEEEDRSILSLFIKLTNELMNEGFLGEMMQELNAEPESEKVTKIPQDHKKSTKK